MNTSGTGNASDQIIPFVDVRDVERISQQGISELQKDSDSASRDTGSDVPFPFDSQSSLGEESGEAYT